MENREAIEELKEYHTTMDEYDLEYMEILISKELCDLAISAVEKQTRKKGEVRMNGLECMTCGGLNSYDHDFCQHCGQRLTEVSP
jgi:hypothetical protein